MDDIDKITRRGSDIVSRSSRFLEPSVVPSINTRPSAAIDAEIDELLREAKLEGYSAGRADGEQGCATLDEARALLMDIETADQLPPLLQLRISQFLSRPTH